jgi:hypothetical protein
MEELLLRRAYFNQQFMPQSYQQLASTGFIPYQQHDHFTAAAYNQHVLNTNQSHETDNESDDELVSTNKRQKIEKPMLNISSGNLIFVKLVSFYSYL